MKSCLDALGKVKRGPFGDTKIELENLLNKLKIQLLIRKGNLVSAVCKGYFGICDVINNHIIVHKFLQLLTCMRMYDGSNWTVVTYGIRGKMYMGFM